MKIKRVLRQVTIDYQINKVSCNVLVQVMDDSDNLIMESPLMEELKDSDLTTRATFKGKSTWDEVEVLDSIEEKYPKDELVIS